jgi:hypothetical protein
MGKYDIGVVKQEDGTYALEADWWGVETTRGIKEEEVVKEVNAKYAYQRVVAAVEEQGYTIDTNAVQADGTVKLTVHKDARVAWPGSPTTQPTSRRKSSG